MYLGNIKKNEDYFANDDSVIRSPTYYTRTHLDPTNLPKTDLRSLLTPMWNEENKYEDNTFMSTQAQTEYDDTMDFEKKMDDRL